MKLWEMYWFGWLKDMTPSEILALPKELLKDIFEAFGL